MNAFHDFGAPASAIADAFRRRQVRLPQPPYITLDRSEYHVLRDLTAAEQTGALPVRGR